MNARGMEKHNLSEGGIERTSSLGREVKVLEKSLAMETMEISRGRWCVHLDIPGRRNLFKNPVLERITTPRSSRGAQKGCTSINGSESSGASKRWARVGFRSLGVIRKKAKRIFTFGAEAGAITVDRSG